jgi:hypothetical protein
MLRAKFVIMFVLQTLSGQSSADQIQRLPECANIAV